MPNKPFVDIKKAKLYGSIALAMLVLGRFSDMAQHEGEMKIRFHDDLWRMPYVTILNYILFEYTIPYLSPKKFFRSLLLVFAHLFLYTRGLWYWRELGVIAGIYTPIPAGSHELEPQVEYSFASILFFGIIRHIYNHIKLKQTAQQLKIEKQQAELNFLKSQTNPHFLFNTLNNIYSLARDKSDQAPETILRLSKLLRYMLYEAGGAYIAVEQELKIISDYIALERLRYDDTLRVNFNHDVEDMHQALPPLLLMPLVENAFKHGVSETRNRPFVDIHLSITKRQLRFIVSNSTEESPFDPPAGGARPPAENIGLSNLRRQLELQYTEYGIALDQKPGTFTATLTINLASHVKN